MKAKSTCPRIVNTKLPLLRAPELHLPKAIGSGLATAQAMFALTSRTMASGCLIRVACSHIGLREPPNLTTVTLVKACARGPTGWDGWFCMAGWPVYGVAIVTDAYDCSVRFICCGVGSAWFALPFFPLFRLFVACTHSISGGGSSTAVRCWSGAGCLTVGCTCSLVHVWLVPGSGISITGLFFIVAALSMADSLAMKGCMAVCTTAVSAITSKEGVCEGEVLGTLGSRFGFGARVGCGVEPEAVRLFPVIGTGRDGRGRHISNG